MNKASRHQRRQELMHAALLACHNFFDGDTNQPKFYLGPYPGVYARVTAVLQGQDQITKLRAETPELTPI